MTIQLHTLIIVDDEAAIRETLFLVFTQLGYHVRTAEDGFAALALICDSPPDIILSDLNMPGMSGFGLLSVVRRMYPSIFVVATSGAFVGESVPIGIAADGFYQKATSLSVLLEKMNASQILDRRQLTASHGKAPVWMVPAGRLASQELYVLISCPSCLKAFPKVIARKDALVCATGCPHCQTVITYAVAPSKELQDGVFAKQSSIFNGALQTGGGSEAPDVFFAGL